MTRLCVKCENPGEYFSLESTQVYFCYNCYLESIKQKFRSALSKTKLFTQRASYEILVVGEDDARSEALNKLIKESYDEKKKLKLTPRIFYIDFSDERNNGRKIDETREDQPTAVNISMAFGQHIDYNRTTTLQIPECDYFYVRRLLPDNAAVRDEFKRLLVDYFIYQIAESLRIPTVFTTENAESLSQKTLSVACMGRGSSIPHLTNVVDKRHPWITIIRPLRNITNAEITFLTSKLPSTNYGDSVSAKFLEEVTSKGYPGTVSTVMSVASKIQAIAEKEIDSGVTRIHCWLCQMPTEKGLCKECTNFSGQIPFRQRQDFLSAFHREEFIGE